ncbi:helix-turn-helix domain-containing protein [Flexithrix dorotheae]|uniref:helix-turn-helix domain-containing protein n=1 Tax=Flexithrix dorotheae TaxID=70993 RepID=UPI00037E9109|nr:AraC family transcriptional regulator [Flexithrix dorotheae]
MVLTQFPNLHWLKKQIQENFNDQLSSNGRILPQKGWPTVLLNVKTKAAERNQVKGPLSLFMNLKGKSVVQVENKSVEIPENCFFISNNRQYYSLGIEEEVETFNIHLGDNFLNRVSSGFANSPEFLLDNGDGCPIPQFNFHNKLYFKTTQFQEIIEKIYALGKEGLLSNLQLEELLVELALHLQIQENNLKESIAQIPTIKKSTREELKKKLFLATDYLYSFYNSNISLEELAQVAGISKYHFLRLFKIVFGESPHQMLTAIRIKKAEEKLIYSSLSINEIAWLIGMENSSSFSRLFRKFHKIYPSKFREKYRNLPQAAQGN